MEQTQNKWQGLKVDYFFEHLSLVLSLGDGLLLPGLVRQQLCKLQKKLAAR